uniref:EGF-like domain-containing protein n=1 Tax=Rhabditophanes sp. KR3021 TaxID=114890 RepID=A0AC35TVD6_9BILA
MHLHAHVFQQSLTITTTNIFTNTAPNAMLAHFIIFFLISNNYLLISSTELPSKGSFLNADEVNSFSFNNGYKLVQMIMFYDANEFPNNKSLKLMEYTKEVVTRASQLLYPLNVFLVITDYVGIKESFAKPGDINQFRNFYSVAGPKLIHHNVAVLLSKFTKNTHAYRRGICSDKFQNIISARIDLSPHHIRHNAEQLSIGILTLIGHSTDDEMSAVDKINWKCTCTPSDHHCFTVMDKENCYLNRLLHRFSSVDCLHQSYKYFSGQTLSTICGNGIVERGEVCDSGPFYPNQTKLFCSGGCEWNQFTVNVCYGLSIGLFVMVVVLVVVVVGCRCQNWRKRKAMKNVNLLYNPHASTKSKNGKKRMLTIEEENEGTLSSFNTSTANSNNSAKTTVIIGLNKDNSFFETVLDTDSTYSDPPKPKISSFPYSTLSTSVSLPNNELSGIFVGRQKNGRTYPNQSFNGLKSKTNQPSPLASNSINLT